MNHNNHSRKLKVLDNEIADCLQETQRVVETRHPRTLRQPSQVPRAPQAPFACRLEFTNSDADLLSHAWLQPHACTLSLMSHQQEHDHDQSYDDWYPSNYFKADDVIDNPLDLTITAIRPEKMQDGKPKPCVFFKED